jgi:hypothetical protein
MHKKTILTQKQQKKLGTVENIQIIKKMIDMKKLKLFLFDKKQYVPSKANQRAET